MAFICKSSYSIIYQLYGTVN